MSRKTVLNLYKRILKTGKSWKAASTTEGDTFRESEYIVNEAKLLFRKNKQVSDANEIQQFIKEGESRLELALHYKNPYPRPVYFSKTAVLGLKEKGMKSLKHSKPVYIKSYDLGAADVKKST